MHLVLGNGRSLVESPIAKRLANAVNRFLDSESDARSVREWAGAIGVSEGALKGWCHAIGVRPKAALDLARVLRASQIGCRTGGQLPPSLVLDIVDRRTLRNLQERSGFHWTGALPPPSEVLRAQRFVVNPAFTHSLKLVIAQHRREPGRAGGRPAG